MKRLRVALMGLAHESNTFVEAPTGLGHFRAGHWSQGADIPLDYGDAHHEIGGMLQALREADIEVVPVLYAEATPGGTVSADAFEALCERMFSALRPCLPVDGCLVVPHGAGVSEVHADMDGEWLSRLRRLVGGVVPVIGTLDPHANLSARMVEACDALVAYRTNPHTDQRQVGLEAGRILADTLRGRVRPLQRHRPLPFAISIEQQRTDRDPCRALLQRCSEVSRLPGILSASLIIGFPYADVPEMGSSFVVVADDDAAAAEAALDLLEAEAMRLLDDFNGHREGIAGIMPRIPATEKPILLLDMGDNVGGGSPGDSTHLLDSLDDGGIAGAFICIQDPSAVRMASGYKLGETFPLRFGRDPLDGASRARMFTLQYKGAGAFTEEKPRHGGQMRFDMGDIAVGITDKGQTVMLTSLRTAPFSLNQLTSFGLDPATFTCIVAKGVNAPIAAYRDACPVILQVDTPGVTQADMTRFSYRHRRRPLFPFEDPRVFDAGLRSTHALSRLAMMDFYTEGPAVGGAGDIFFTTLAGGGIMRLDPAGRLHAWASSACPNGQAILPTGDHLFCDSRLGRVRRVGAGGGRTQDFSSESYGGVRVHVPNDLVVDGAGYVYFTDSIRHAGSVFCIAPDGQGWQVAAGLDYPNGIALSPDGGSLFVAESYGNRILRFELSAPGRVHGGFTVFADLPVNPTGDPIGNLPDGIAFNGKGMLAVAHYGMQRVQLLAPDGTLAASLDSGMPCTSNVCFIDDDTLVVTGGYAEPGPGAVFLLRL